MNRTRAGMVAIAVALGSLAAREVRGDQYSHPPSNHGESWIPRREGLMVQFAFVYAALRADEAKLHTLQSEPDLLRDGDLRLDGGTQLTGGSLSIHFVMKGIRFGMVETFSGASGLRLLRNPLPDGYSVEASAWRLSVEANVGHQFAVGKLAPYADLRLGFSMLNASVGLVAPGAGRLGTTNYTAWAPVIGPRVGVIVPLTKAVVADVAVTYGLIGHDAVGLSLGLGYNVFGR